MSVASGVLMIAHLEASKVRLDPSVTPHTRSLLRNIRVRGVGSGGAALPSSLHLFLAERDRIRNSISVVKKDQAQRGHYLGDIVPFGSTVNDDRALVEDVQQQAAIREMIVLKDEGKSLRTTSEIMKKRGIAISHIAVGDVLKKARQTA
jgi:hypothetical protein